MFSRNDTGIACAFAIWSTLRGALWLLSASSRIARTA
jgi:hypothetical protein